MALWPLLLLGGGVAVVAVAGGKKKGGARHHAVGGFAPPPSGTPDAEGDELGPLIPIDVKFKADFRLTSGEYQDVNVPSVCIPGVYCSPPIKVKAGFPDNFIPAGPSVTEVWSGNTPIFVTAGIGLRAEGYEHVCKAQNWEGTVGKNQGEEDVPITSVTNKKMDHPNCDYQISKESPRLTMVTQGSSRRLILMVPPGENGQVRIDCLLSIWQILNFEGG